MISQSIAHAMKPEICVQHLLFGGDEVRVEAVLRVAQSHY
jgi:hypothetical protein